jgi:hypothetical protein
MGFGEPSLVQPALSGSGLATQLRAKTHRMNFSLHCVGLGLKGCLHHLPQSRPQWPHQAHSPTFGAFGFLGAFMADSGFEYFASPGNLAGAG